MTLFLTLKAGDPLSEDVLDSMLVVILTSQIRFLQAEKYVCFVNGKFGDKMGTLFREFKEHSSSFSTADIATLERVAQLSNARSQRPASRPHSIIAVVVLDAHVGELLLVIVVEVLLITTHRLERTPVQIRTPLVNAQRTR